MITSFKETVIQSGFAILFLISIFLHSSLFTDPYIVPKWLFAILIILGMGIYFSVATLLGKSVTMNTSLVGKSMAIICCFQALYGLLQYFSLLPSNSVYGITGSFDNPAGFAITLSAGLPFIGFLIQKGNSKYFQYVGWATGIILLTAIILSYSRAGIVSVIVICALFLYSRFIRKRIWKYILLGSVVLVIVGCYWMKKDSADGRLLIWQCGINMVKDSPWIGHGMGSFEAHYMDYQAEYFSMHGQQNNYAMLADNVKQPFNEYLGVLLNFGIIGLLVLAAIIFLLFYCYKKNVTNEKRIALYALISIGTFSLFSYPFTYPFTWIIVFLSVFIIIREYIEAFLAMSWRRNLICILVLGCSIVGIYKLVERIQAELKWGKISKLALCGAHSEALPAYEKLEKFFADNPYFLYNYAAVLLEDKQYEKSLEVSLKCRQYWADYDLELIIGETYQQLREDRRAEAYYNNAALMCPSRFLPFYKLFTLYKENGKKKQMYDIAELIVNKPVKIRTSSILMMKRNAKKTLLGAGYREFVSSP
ncbi:O-antigen ligase family protein [Bacteroides sp.]|uniref:O-antigen ligase family protein n=1 Tax=Bacteroides sp. TaxID=29523 RepID=UPI0026327C20|nr:O-antigen ligase family protein [Bacteroides sp.]MDD3038301.1 O-antigen ligase family protein [Bacteroides sp.]